MQIKQTWDGTVQDRYTHETAQYKTDILTLWDCKGLMQIIQTWEGQYKTNIVTRWDSTRQIYFRDRTVRD